MPDYNDDQNYVDSLLIFLQDGDEDVYRAHISSRRIILTGNTFEDKMALILESTQTQNIPLEPIILPSDYSKEDEMGQSTASWATSSHTSPFSRELQEELPSDYRDFEPANLKIQVLNAAREIARDYRSERLFGKPHGGSTRTYIIDKFEQSLLDFFQEKDEKTAYKGNGGMRQDERSQLAKLVHDSINNMDHKDVYKIYTQQVTRGQERFIDQLRMIRGV